MSETQANTDQSTDKTSTDTTDVDPPTQSKTRVAITGASGRMGTELRSLANERSDIGFTLAITRTPDAIPDPSTESVDAPDATVQITGEISETALKNAFETHSIDVLIDFTAPDASIRYLDAVDMADRDIAAVIGTTGYDDAQHSMISSLSDTTAILKASNFSRGIAALRRAVTEAVSTLPSYDIEVTETHHNGKRDAPSGTAVTLLDDIDTARDETESATRVHGRVGDTPRSESEIGVHARRAGDIAGEHEVLMAGGDEVIELTHRAGSRGIFAAGALDAATWIAGRPPSQYDFDAVLDAGANSDEYTEDSS
ncbi:4-hydroxy-tetrahydrodipicolinate reductase [Haloquadratum walsbyi]|jgi:dihydrodipicolinate reductase (EC 1.3.1.26)|uniref:4-hydroxy-tetrahydrodipicolinate reductase n=1 Tax=Haloquadratum walsbyi J07HQW2 TaxID=1238425 RepID=U1PRV8_9EURY|nr:4-hydroxy-tetrahydrodipicolinate reductase [Haloquadratum walsbyi]ERG96507.1 MAG: dihydrodipicolinate reductase [Haloquadratum walsbyi J07HQW2]